MESSRHEEKELSSRFQYHKIFIINIGILFCSHIYLNMLDIIVDRKYLFHVQDPGNGNFSRGLHFCPRLSIKNCSSASRIACQRDVLLLLQTMVTKLHTKCIYHVSISFLLLTIIDYKGLLSMSEDMRVQTFTCIDFETTYCRNGWSKMDPNIM